jgi:hypothetical protein
LPLNISHLFNFTAWSFTLLSHCIWNILWYKKFDTLYIAVYCFINVRIYNFYMGIWNFANPEWNISLSVMCIIEICYKHVGSRMTALA